jgi:hypothetical protein
LGTKPAIKVDLFEGSLGEGERLFLCSDGLTGHVEDIEIDNTLRSLSPERAVEQLVDLAKDRGGTDNITVLTVGERRLKVPAPAPAAEARKPFPIIPVLAIAGVLAVAALVGAFVIPRLLGGSPTPTLMPTMTVTVPPSTQSTEIPAASPTEQGEVVPSHTSMPTQPLDPVTLTPAEGSAGTGTGAEDGVEPTATLMTTLTDDPDAPGPTSPMATGTTEPEGLVPTAAPSVSYSSPVLVAPLAKDAQSVQGKVTFQWSYSRSLRSGEAFQVLIWKEGQSHDGAAELVRNTEQTIDLDILLPQRGGPGEYLWTVVLRDSSTEKKLSPEAPPWRLNYTAGSSPQGDTEGKGTGCGLCDCENWCKGESCMPCCERCCNGCK